MKKPKATKKNFSKKKKSGKKKKSALSKKQKAAVERMIKEHPETKCKVQMAFVTGTTAGSSAWDVDTLNALTQGTDVDERIGLRVEPVGVRLRYYLNLGDFRNVTVRVILFYNLNDTRTTDLPTSVLYNAEPSTVQVLKDWYVSNGKYTDGGSNEHYGYKVYDKWIKVRRSTWVYKDESTDPENYDRLCLGVYAVNAQGTYTSSDTQLIYSAYVYYKDA